MIMPIPRRALIAGGTAALLLSACRRGSVDGMVVDPATERMYGMRSDGALFTDPALYPNRRLKLTLRNMSGDPVWDLDDTREQIYRGYLDKGYERSDGVDFGLKVDLNVVRSQQFDRDMMAQYSFLGAAAGAAAGLGVGGVVAGTAGVASGAAIGTASGVSLGTLAGYFVQDNIYVVITQATFAIRRHASKPRRVITFDGSPRIEEWEESTTGAFQKVEHVTISNYGGGRSVTQKDIADDIRARQVRSLISLI